MKKTVCFSALLLMALCIGGCGEEEAGDDKQKKDFISVVSYLKSQVAHIDTSLYPIIEITSINNGPADTVSVPRERFREVAAEFLAIPDIAEKKYKKKYTEEESFDQTLNRAVISYLPVNPDKEIIQRQDLLITPDPAGDRFSNIFVDYLINSRDSSVQKRMLWIPGHSFQITTIKQLPGQPEQLTTRKVIWDAIPEEDIEQIRIAEPETNTDSVSGKASRKTLRK